MGQDGLYPDVAINQANRTEAPIADVQADHAKLVRQIGAEAVVILRNKNDILPLSNKLEKIALVGSDAGPDPK